MPSLCSQMPKEGTRFIGTGVIDSCELPHGYRESYAGPLEKQPVLSATEPSIQTLNVLLATYHDPHTAVLLA